MKTLAKNLVKTFKDICRIWDWYYLVLVAALLLCTVAILYCSVRMALCPGCPWWAILAAVATDAVAVVISASLIKNTVLGLREGRTENND